MTDEEKMSAKDLHEATRANRAQRDAATESQVENAVKNILTDFIRPASERGEFRVKLEPDEMRSATGPFYEIRERVLARFAALGYTYWHDESEKVSGIPSDATQAFWISWSHPRPAAAVKKAGPRGRKKAGSDTPESGS